MQVKKWLNRGRNLNELIDSLIEEQRQLDNFRIKTKKEYLEYEDKINKKIDRLVLIKEEIHDVIDLVEDTELQTLLTHRYINMLTWPQIAEKIHIDLRWIHRRVHPDALAAVERILDMIQEVD